MSVCASGLIANGQRHLLGQWNVIAIRVSIVQILPAKQRHQSVPDRMRQTIDKRKAGVCSARLADESVRNYRLFDERRQIDDSSWHRLQPKKLCNCKSIFFALILITITECFIPFSFSYLRRFSLRLNCKPRAREKKKQIRNNDTQHR